MTHPIQIGTVVHVPFVVENRPILLLDSARRRWIDLNLALEIRLPVDEAARALVQVLEEPLCPEHL